MNFILKKAVVTAGRGARNEFQVRVMPDMAEITETQYLPFFPNFLADNNVMYTPNEQVWVVCDNTFTVGFILGRLQSTSGDDLSNVMSLINSAEAKAGLTKSSVTDLSIIRVGGKSITFENTRTGQYGHIYNSKVVMIIGAEGEGFMSYPRASIKIDKAGNINIAGKTLTEEVESEILKAGSSKEEVGLKTVDSTGAIKHTASGPIKSVTASYREEATAGDSQELVAKKKKETYGLGKETMVVAGGSKDTTLLGNYEINVVAGKISLRAGAGIDLLTSMLSVTSPLVKFPAMGLVAPGMGPFCALPFCLMTGAPHTGNIQTGGL